MATAAAVEPSAPATPLEPPLVKRHRLSTRLWHWINALAMAALLGSGLMIFNAHPRLYWGSYGANPDPAWLEIGSRGNTGFTRVGPLTIETTGVLGLSQQDGRVSRLAFPGWATIPSTYDLAGARRWHLFFAWVFALSLLGYMVAGFLTRHFPRDLVPSREELRPSHIWADIKDHARLRLPVGEAALHYGVLQKLSYFAVIFILLPMMIGTGLAMSPALNAAWPWMLDLFGGRQSARSLHFIATFLLFGFFVVHIVMTLVSGPWNQMRGMITGRFRLPAERIRPEQVQ